MNKTILKSISTLALLSFVFGCAVQKESSSSLDNSSSKQLSLEEMLEVIQDDNITYHSDYLIYYYDLDNIDEVITLQRFDVYAKITEDLYDMTAYDYEKRTVASYAHLEKDSEGYVTYSDVNIKNELVTQRALDNTSCAFLWKDSVYYNLAQYLKAEDFKLNSDGTYTYANELDEVPLDIVHTAIPVSNFDLESLTLTVKDNMIESLIFQEFESDQAYENCMYGRTLTLKFEDIGTTTISRIRPYVDNPENDDLGLALEEMRSLTNYTIESTGTLDDGSTLNFYNNQITEKDIFQTQYTDEGEYHTGIHTYQDELYIFESTKGYLLGQKAASNVKVSNFLPTFDFSEDVFKLVFEKGTYKVYSPYASMSEVLDFVDVLMEHSGEYYSPAGEIEFYVFDGKLDRITFPVYVYESVEPLIAIQEISFINKGTTSIEESVWNKFTLEIPEVEVTSWHDDAYKFDFEISDDESVEMTIGEVFDKCLGSATEVPYFLPSNASFDVFGGCSKDKNGNYESAYIELSPLSSLEDDVFTNAKNALENGGYTYTKVIEGEDMYLERFTKGEVVIDFVYVVDELEMIAINLPLGSILD